MKSPIRLARPMLAALAAAAVAGAAAQAAHAGPAAPDVPPRIQVEAGHKLYSVQHATGVQIYSCNATAGGFGWSFVAPRADLFNGKGKVTGTHFGGPTWQANDGSRVVGRRVDGVSVDPSAVDWLLLAAASTSAGADGDRLTNTTYIQRIATTGGLAPAAADCNAQTAGTQAEVPYSADYYFWKAAGR